MSLEEIRARVENAPRLLVSKANEGGYEHPASVYQEEDGLDMLCYMPHVYHPEWQDHSAEQIVSAYEDRGRLLAALDAVLEYGNDYTRSDLSEIVNEALENWKRPGELTGRLR